MNIALDQARQQYLDFVEVVSGFPNAAGWVAYDGSPNDIGRFGYALYESLDEGFSGDIDNVGRYLLGNILVVSHGFQWGDSTLSVSNPKLGAVVNLTDIPSSKGRKDGLAADYFLEEKYNELCQVLGLTYEIRHG